MLSWTEMAVTEEEAQAYATSRGLFDWFASPEALRRGQDFIAGLYNGRWKGEWSNDEAPDEVKFAIVEAAYYELKNPHALQPVVTANQQLTREKIGPLEFEYAEVSAIPENARPVLTKIRDMLRLLAANPGETTSTSLLLRV